MLLKFSKDIKALSLNIFMFLMTIIVMFYIIQNVEHAGYALLFTHPLLYCLVFIFFLNPTLLNSNNNLFYAIFTMISFIRYILLPFLIVYTGYYGGRSQIPPTEESYATAILLMNFELISVSFLIYFLNKKNKKKIKYNRLPLDKQDTHQGYYLFIFLTIILALLFPASLNQINFLIPTSINLSYELSTLDNMVLYCLIISIQLIYIIIIKKIYFKYMLFKNKKWIFISIIITLINISIYFGTNRMDIIISALVSIYVLKKMYGKQIYGYFIIIVPIIIILFQLVTSGRNYISVSGGTSQLIDITDTFQVYTGGVYNVAIAVETIKFYPEVRNFKILFMDIFRPMIGVNIFIKNLNIPFSNLFFNQRIRPNSNLVSQILPMIGQGYIFFGTLFSVLIPIFFIIVQYLLEKIINKTKSLEVFYFVSLTTARLGILMGQNTMNIINDMSMNLALFLIVYNFNKYFRFQKNIKVGKV